MLRHLLALALGAASLPLAGCAFVQTTRTEAPATVRQVVAGLAEQLVTTAAQRTPLGSMRVLVDDLVALETANGAHARFAGDAEPEVDLRELERDLFLELAARLYVYEEPVGTRATADPQESLADRAVRLGATHAVLGSWTPADGGIEVALRLVDLRTGLIVAPASTWLGLEPAPLPATAALDAIPELVQAPAPTPELVELEAPVPELSPLPTTPFDGVARPLESQHGDPNHPLSHWPNSAEKGVVPAAHTLGPKESAFVQGNELAPIEQLPVDGPALLRLIELRRRQPLDPPPEAP